MIRYWIDGQADLVMAACCQPRLLRRLAGCGPWEAQHVNGRTCITMQRGTVDAWGPEQVGTGGIAYQLADPLPEFDPSDWMRRDVEGRMVPLLCGVCLPIPAATVAGSVIRLDGSLGPPRLVGGYAQALQRIMGRIEAGEHIEYDDPDIVALCRQAIRAGTYLTDELIHAWELLTTADVDAIVGAAAGLSGEVV
jgi:hypothetical protein